MNQTHDRIGVHQADPAGIGPAGPEEERELRAVVALLRSLPDPEPPDDLAARVIAEVRRRESGPRVVRIAFRRFEPLVAAAAAAGIGALVLTTAMQSGLLGQNAPTPEAPSALKPMPAHRVADADPALPPQIRPRFEPLYVALPGSDLRGAHLQAAPSPTPLTSSAFDPRAPFANPLDRRLDRELNSLLLDPPAFFARLQQMAHRDTFVSRLVDRATRRGDAAQIALRLRMRSPEHPETAVLVDRLLREAMVIEDPQH